MSMNKFSDLLIAQGFMIKTKQNNEVFILELERCHCGT